MVQAVPADGGRLRVTVTVQGAGNGLHALRFGGPSSQMPVPNALVQAADGTLYTPPAALALGGQPTTYTFHVLRTTPGQATTLVFTVVDACGEWPTFVGGGPAAF